MPIKSMTGYGEQNVLTAEWEVCIRLKTLNHRHLDARVTGLDRFPVLQLKVRDLLQKSFARGRVDLDVEVRRAHQAPTLTFDATLARHYMEELSQFSKELGLKQQPTLELLLNMEGVTERAPVEEETLWSALEGGLEQAMQHLQQMRVREGQHLEQELCSFIERLEALTQVVAERMPKFKDAFRQRLQERVASVRTDLQLNEQRFEEEVILYVERCDISEEVARLHSHFAAVRGALAGDQPAGKVLDFLAQEMGREINTLGSKAKDVVISHHVIEMKSVLEKFREQGRNIE